MVIAALSVDDAHHATAATAITSAADDDLVLAATTRAEVLIGPARVGGAAFTMARDFVDECVAVPISASIADDAAALRAHHRGLSLPDALAIVVAELIDADAVWTFDHRWPTVTSRVTVLSTLP